MQLFRYQRGIHMMESLGKKNSKFIVTIEVVPPGGNDIGPLMTEAWT